VNRTRDFDDNVDVFSDGCDVSRMREISMRHVFAIACSHARVLLQCSFRAAA